MVLGEGEWVIISLVVVGLIILVLAIVIGRFFKLWVQALFSQTRNAGRGEAHGLRLLSGAEVRLVGSLFKQDGVTLLLLRLVPAGPRFSPCPIFWNDASVARRPWPARGYCS